MGSPALWSKLAVIGWVIILTVLAAYEIWCLVSGDPHTPPLTRVTIKYVPWYVTLPFLTWLLIHFIVRYFNPSYIKGLQ